MHFLPVNNDTDRLLSETAAGENATAYFPLLDRVAEGRFSKAKTDADVYDAFLQVLREDGHINTPDAFSTFNLALSLRSAAPRIEAHYQYYATAIEPTLKDVNDDMCESWVQIDTDLFCEPALEKPHGNSKLL